MKLSDGKVTIDGELDVSDITLDGTALAGNAAAGINKISAVSSTQAELDILSGATIDTGELNRLKGLTYNIKDKFNLKLDISEAQDTYAPKAGSSNIVTVGALTSGSIGGAMVINTVAGNITGSTVTGTKFKTTGLEITDNKIGISSVPELVTISGNNVIVDGTINTSSLQLSGSAVTASASEINKLDGLTTSKAELQFVKGVGSSIQDQIDARITTNDANATYVPLAGHASIATVGKLTAGSIDGPAFGVINITSNITTTGDVNADAFKTGSIVMKDANIGHSGDPTLMTVSAGLLNVSGTVKATGLNLNNTPVNATASEINKLAGLSVTQSELEYLSGVTVSSNLKDDLVARYTKTETDGLFDDFTGQNKITTVGALTSGSIGSGFTSISTETPIQTTSTLSGSSVTGGSITLSGSVISHSSDPTLMTLSSGKVTVGGELKTTSLTLGNSPVTANAGEINKLTGLSTTAIELGYLNGVSGPIQTQIGDRYTKSQTDDLFDDFVGQSNITTVGALTAGSIGGNFSSIDMGGQIKTSVKITGGSLKAGNLEINGSTLGHSTKTDMLTLTGTGVELDGILDTASLKLNGSAITANAGELNIMDGVTVTTDEINSLAGIGTTSVKNQLTAKLNVLDAMDIYAPIVGHASIATVGTLIGGSIAGNFGSIDIGENHITAGSISVGDVVIDDNTIGHKNNTNLMTLNSSSLNVNKPLSVTGKVTASTLNIENTDLVAGAAEAINKMVNVNASADELNLLNGISTNITTDNFDNLEGLPTTLTLNLAKN